MIGITVTAEAYAAIKATLPAGTKTWPTSPADQGDVIICLDQATVDRLDAIRGPASDPCSMFRHVSTRVGCVIVGTHKEIRAIGYNGFPRGVDDDRDARHERPVKYKWTEHAERNAIYSSARAGISIDGCTMYLPWFPCMDCARAIVQSVGRTLERNDGIFTGAGFWPSRSSSPFRHAEAVYRLTRCDGRRIQRRLRPRCSRAGGGNPAPRAA
jgi:hypothetical protein